MSVLPKLINRLNAISIRILARFSVAIDKISLKFICKGKGDKIDKTILEKNKVRGLSLPDFKTYYIATVIKRMCY